MNFFKIFQSEEKDSETIKGIKVVVAGFSFCYFIGSASKVSNLIVYSLAYCWFNKEEVEKVFLGLPEFAHFLIRSDDRDDRDDK